MLSICSPWAPGLPSMYLYLPTLHHTTHSYTNHCNVHQDFKGELSPKKRVDNMIELLLKSFLVYLLPMFEVWKVPKRPVEVSCDITQHLAAYRTAVETRTDSFGMRTHTKKTLTATLHAYTNFYSTSCT